MKDPLQFNPPFGIFVDWVGTYEGLENELGSEHRDVLLFHGNGMIIRDEIGPGKVMGFLGGLLSLGAGSTTQVQREHESSQAKEEIYSKLKGSLVLISGYLGDRAGIIDPNAMTHVTLTSIEHFPPDTQGRPLNEFLEYRRAENQRGIAENEFDRWFARTNLDREVQVRIRAALIEKTNQVSQLDYSALFTSNAPVRNRLAKFFLEKNPNLVQ